jgi:hypothetical protein
LNAGQWVVLILNRDLHDAIFDLSDGMDDARLMLLDSEQTLERLIVDGRVNGDRFDEVIGGLMRSIVARSRSSRVRAYGDMVDVLWQRGRRADAVELERHWNDLQAQLPFELYCAYDIDVFSEEFQAQSIAPVLCEHSQVVPAGRAELNAALDYAAYETLGRRCPPLPDAEATILWLRANVPERASEILQRAKHYASG